MSFIRELKSFFSLKNSKIRWKIVFVICICFTQVSQAFRLSSYIRNNTKLPEGQVAFTAHTPVCKVSEVWAITKAAYDAIPESDKPNRIFSVPLVTKLWDQIVGRPTGDVLIFLEDNFGTTHYIAARGSIVNKYTQPRVILPATYDMTVENMITIPAGEYPILREGGSAWCGDNNAQEFVAERTYVNVSQVFASMRAVRGITGASFGAILGAGGFKSRQVGGQRTLLVAHISCKPPVDIECSSFTE